MSDTEHLAEWETEQFMKNAEGKRVYRKYWIDKTSKPSALVFLSHGAGEHCLLYNGLAEVLVKEKLFVFAHDHIGHGRTEGDRVHLVDFNTYVQDTFQHIDLVVEKLHFQDLPIFIVGHSMGGTIAVMCAIARPDFFRGVILIAPAIIASPDVAPPWKISLSRGLARIAPQFQIAKLRPEYASRDEDVVRNYKKDPLIFHGGMKVGWAVLMFKTFDKIKENIEKIEWPFLTMHGDQDKLTDPAGSQLLYDKAASKDKTYKVYKDHYHQLHNELKEDSDIVRNDIKTWIVERI